MSIKKLNREATREEYETYTRLVMSDISPMDWVPLRQIVAWIVDRIWQNAGEYIDVNTNTIVRIMGEMEDAGEIDHFIDPATTRRYFHKTVRPHPFVQEQEFWRKLEGAE